MAGAGRTGFVSAEDGFAITPNDGVDLEIETRQIVVGGVGTVAMTLKSGRDVSFVCVAGQTLQVRATRVKATGTSATSLVGLV